MKHSAITIHVPFAKVDEDQRMVYGYATTDSLDSQGEVVSKDAIRKAWDAYMKFANVREMHQPSAVGVTKEYQHDDKGTWIGVKVVDDRAWKFVKEGVYKGFSIGGRIIDKVDNIIKELVLAEISLVDRPSCPDAVFEVVKMDDSAISALATLTKEQRLMDLTLITQKDPSTLTDEEKAYLRENVEQLTDEQRTHFADALQGGEAPEGGEGGEAPEGEKPEGGEAPDAGETPAGGDEGGETPEGEATPASGEGGETPEAGAEGGDAVVPEGGEPAEPAPEAPAGEGAPVENAVKPEVTKDARGVIGLSDMLAHLEYVIEYFKGDGRNTKNLENARSDIMKAIEDEARTKGMNPTDMQKMMSESFKKVLEESGLSKVVSDIAALQKDMEVVKGTRVAKRPTTTAVVEKGENNGDKTVSKLQEDLAGIQKEIDAFHVKAQGVTDPGRKAELMDESTQLFTKFRNKQREINEAMAKGNF